MKAVLLSIQPKWCEKIASGEKTIEIRKTRPKINTPFKCYIYETKNTRGVHGFTILGRYRIGKVIGEFMCRGIMRPYSNLTLMSKQSCLTIDELNEYSKGKELYGWRIADLRIYSEPKELSEFYSAKECKHYYGGYSGCEDVCGYAENNECRGGHKQITRPPQTWQYVEV